MTTRKPTSKFKKWWKNLGVGIHPITLEVEAEDQNLRPPWTMYREGNWLKTAIHIFLHFHTYVGQRTYVNSSQKKKNTHFTDGR